ncbi:MAG: Tm-1-like ATP-binding domain-containing protein [Thermodesulfobacteriota bacterium]|nr:Tm-1-like ATP-binding domain-containing protein [Thermodesulfobacteriota bacterium]
MERKIAAQTATVLIVATMDTKGEETAFLKNCFSRMGIPVLIMDAGIRGESLVPVEITREQVAESGGKTLVDVRNIGHEGESLNIMISGALRLAQNLYRKGEISGIISLGGSMGTTLATAVMRTFPIGFPKVMISTMASRDTRAFVGTSDILMLHSVCDLVGINRITARILHNGAAAMAGMIQHPPEVVPMNKSVVIVSTLGTTEACAQRIRHALEQTGREVVIFHTVGAGGEAMEEMIAQEEIAAVVDLSLHEMADHRFGGDYDAGPLRGSAALEKGIPTILVPGNIDFIVTGPKEKAQKKFPGRTFHQHNAAITVIRSDPEEMEILGHVIADICNQASGTWSILIPMGGFSAFDSNGGPMPDQKARQCFTDALQQRLNENSRAQTFPYHINDPDFAQIVVHALDCFTGKQSQLKTRK